MFTLQIRFCLKRKRLLVFEKNIQKYCLINRFLSTILKSQIYVLKNRIDEFMWISNSEGQIH